MNNIGKISVRFFLNQNVKPQQMSLLGESKLYPLYVQVTFRRKNTQFRSFNRALYTSIDDAFQKNEDKLNYEEYIIQQIVGFEVKTKGKQFKLKGLKERYARYTSDIGMKLDEYLRFTMKASLERSNSKFKTIMDPSLDWDTPIKIYYEASTEIIKDFETLLPMNFNKDMNAVEEFLNWSANKKPNPLLIEWLNETLKEQYRIYLQKKRNSESQVNEKLNLITNAIAFNEM